MPGRLIMNQQAVVGSADLKKDRSKAQEAGLPPKPDFTQNRPGTNGSLSNGMSGQDASLPTTNGQFTSSAEPGQPPPQLDQSWRDSDANKSMGKLIDRLAHQCFEDLSGQISKMADEPAASLLNGAVPQADDPAVKKKRAFMEFAQNQRDRFIKTLVLSDWARHAGDDMAKLVDIKVWQEKQSIAQRNAIYSIGVTKHEVGRSKMPNPNIEGALQFLSTGRASSKVPDLGYIPPKRLTAKQLLRTLQGMNVTLATRLNLHEDLPPHFNDFSVANGRATFRVPGEFEVDLSLADEEPSSPFYFIDIRFSFSPAPRSLDETMRGQLEMRTNTDLATKGLQGCYAFLHNYVLTHKINVIKDQVQKLRNHKWFDCVGIEWKHRVLILEYWKGQPGRKSWLEFGIGTGNSRAPRSRRPATPQLTVRWFRKGQLVDNEDFDVDWIQLDAAKILSGVIAKHTTWLLTRTKHGLERLAGVNSKLEIDLTTSGTTPEDCCLKLRLPSTDSPLAVHVEPVTGWISVSSSTERVAFHERGLNHEVKAEPARVLAHLLCKMVEDRVGNAAELAGWRVLDPHLVKQDNFKSLLGTDFAFWKHYKCSNIWDNGWTVLATYSLSGETWWVARLEQQLGSTGEPAVQIVTSARRIPTGSVLTAKSRISRTSMLQIEKLAVAEVSFMTLSQQLASMQIPHRFEKQAPLIFGESSARIELPPTMAVFFRGASLLKDSIGKDLTISSIKITHQGLVLQPSEIGNTAEARQELRLSVDTNKLTHLKEFLTSNSGDADVAMTQSGSLALRLRTPFGQPYVEQMLERLQAYERVDHYLRVLQHFKFECTTASLHKLAFTYSYSPNLSASFTFPRGDGKLPATLKLQPPSSNPHHRTRVMLEKLFNNRNLNDQFSVVCKSLFHSVGVMQIFEKMDLAHLSTRAFSVHPRHPLLFTLVYKAPLPALTIKLELRERKEKMKMIVAWKIKIERTKQDLDASEPGKQILELAKQKGKDWWGFEDGSFTASTSYGVADVLGKLDEIMRKSIPTSDGPLLKQEIVATPDVKPVPDGAKPQMPQQKQAAQKAPPSNLAQQKLNGIAPGNGPRMMTVNASASPNLNSAAARNGQPKVKKEIIELD